MTEPTTYAPELIQMTRAALEQAGIVNRQDDPLAVSYVVDGDVVELLESLRYLGWIVQPAPVPGIPVNALPDEPPAPGAPDPAPAGNQVDW